MKTRDSIFDSKAETRYFKELAFRWTNKLTVYAQLPLSKLIEPLHADEITDRERGFLYSSNVDYTFCDPTSDKPLLSMEFDGMGHGVSLDGTYQPNKSVSPKRQENMDLKLSLAMVRTTP